MWLLWSLDRVQQEVDELGSQTPLPASVAVRSQTRLAARAEAGVQELHTTLPRLLDVHCSQGLSLGSNQLDTRRPEVENVRLTNPALRMKVHAKHTVLLPAEHGQRI